MPGRSRRFDLGDMPETLPIFPLEGALLLPHARLPLNIFEPRYLAMFDAALASPLRLIGMIQPSGDAPTPPLYNVGCAGRITSFSETDDGRYLIALSGLCRFRIIDELEVNTPYRQVRVSWAPFAQDLSRSDFAMPPEHREAFLRQLKAYLDAGSLSADWDTLAEADDEALTSFLTMLCPFSPEEKQALLEAVTVADRVKDLSVLMEMAVAMNRASGGGELQ